jgi:hypothetical protein
MQNPPRHTGTAALCVLGGFLIGVFAAQSVAIDLLHWPRIGFYGILIVVTGAVAAVAYSVARRY